MKHYSASTYRVGENIGYLIRRAGGLMIQRVETAFAPHEITFVQWLVLMHLRDGLARTGADLCRELSYDSGALTRLVDQLGERGLLLRQRCQEDRRQVQLTITEHGLATVNSLVPLVVDCLNTLLEGFTAEEVASLTRLLGKLVLTLSPSTRHCNAAPAEDRP